MEAGATQEPTAEALPAGALVERAPGEAPQDVTIEERLAALEAENAALKRGELPASDAEVVQHGHDLVQEQADGSRAVVGTHSPDA